MRTWIGILLAFNMALGVAVLTQPVASLAPTALPQWHPERITLQGPAPDRLPDYCVRVHRLTPDDYMQLRNWLGEQHLEHAAVIHLARTPGWWTYLPPVLASDLVTVTRTLAAQGLKDAVQIRKGPMTRAFALGIHASEAQACAQRDTLRVSGLTAVVCGPRPLPNQALLSLPGGDEDVLNALRTRLPGLQARVTECSGKTAAGAASATVLPPPSP